MASAVVGALRILLSADTAEAEKAIAGLDDQTKKLAKTMANDLAPSQSKVNSLVRSFLGSKEIGLAESYAKAVEHIGGANKLTAADQARTNKVVQEALAHYKALGTAAPPALVALANATKQVKIHTDQITPGVAALRMEWLKLTSAFTAGALLEKGLQGVGQAFGMVADFVKDSVKEYVEAEQIQRKVTAALTAQGLAIPTVLAQFDALANKYKDLTVNSDEAIKEVEALLVQVGGVLPSEMDQALDAVTNLSAGLGIDLRSAAMMVSKSFEDNFGALKKAGVQIDETRAKAEGMTYVLGEIQKRFGGQARAEMGSYAGQLKQLENQFKDLQEEIGRTFAESGVLNVGLALAKVGVKLLSLEFLRLLSIISTMPSLKDVAAVGIAGALPKWMKDQAATFDRLVKEMDARRGKDAALASSSGMSKEEFWTGLSIEQEAQQEKDKAEREKTAKGKAKEEADKLTKRNEAGAEFEKQRATGLSDSQRQDQEFWALWRKQRGLTESHAAALALSRGASGPMDWSSLLVNGQMAIPGAPSPLLGNTKWMFGLPMKDNLKALLGEPITSAQLQAGANIPSDSFRTIFGGAMNLLPQTILQAATGGGNFAKSIGALFGGQLAQGRLGENVEGIFKGGFGKTLQSSFLGTKLGGAVAGAIPGIASMGLSSVLSTGGGKGMLSNIASFAAAGSILPGIGTAIGAGIGAIVGIIKAGGNNTKKAREEFAKNIGFESMENLYAKLKSMGDEGAKLANVGLNVIGKNDRAANEKWMKDVTAFFDRLEKVPGKVNELQSALGRIGGVLPTSLEPLLDSILKSSNLSPDLRAQLEGMRKPSWQAAADLAQQFGINPAALGAGFNQSRLAEQAFNLKHSLDLFGKFAGSDQNAILRDMADEFSTLASDALRTGTALPKAVEAFIRQISDMGLLVDENGNMIDAAVLTFADIEDEYQKEVVSLLEQIRDLLTPPATGGGGVPGVPVPPGTRPPNTPPVFDPGMPSLGGATYGNYVMPTTEGMGGTMTVILEQDGRAAARFIAPYLPGEVQRLKLA